MGGWSPSGGGSSFPVGVATGSGAPSTAPPAIGALYIDTTNGQLWIGNGTAAAGNWISAGGANSFGATQSGFGVVPGTFRPVIRNSTGGTAVLQGANGGHSNFQVDTFVSTPPVSSAPALALGTAFQNNALADVIIVVYLGVTANTSLVVSLGVGTTNTPAQQTIVTGSTLTGIIPIPIYIPQSYFALLSVSGTETSSILGQIQMYV